MNSPEPLTDERPRRRRLTFSAIAAAAVATTILAGAPLGQAEAAGTTSARARVVSWVDGDTVRTSRGVVRLIGMDTPEVGQRCYRQAESNAARLAPAGSTITLVKVRGRDNTDRYGRYLRYVQRGTVDVGFRQIQAGYADARYDSGSYGSHPRRTMYHRADQRHPDRTCGSTPPPTPPPTSNCDPSYPTVCIPPPPPDLNCDDVSATDFKVVGSDPHGFDGNHDGVGCES